MRMQVTMKGAAISRLVGISQLSQDYRRADEKLVDHRTAGLNRIIVDKMEPAAQVALREPFQSRKRFKVYHNDRARETWPPTALRLQKKETRSGLCKASITHSFRDRDLIDIIAMSVWPTYLRYKSTRKS
jgi:hypothetical protein